MQGIGQLVLDAARRMGPVGGIFQPVPAVGHIGPNTDAGDTAGQGIDVSLDVVKTRHLTRDPVVRDDPVRPHQVAVDAAQKCHMVLVGNLAEVGDLTHVPQPAHGRGACGQAGDVRIAGQGFQHGQVQGLARAVQAGGRGRLLQAADQPAGRAEVQCRVAPLQHFQRREAVAFHLADHQRVQPAAVAGEGRKAAVVHVPAGAAGDLAHLGGGQRTHQAAVELVQPGEGDMVDVHVQAHADGVGGHQIVHLAGLVQRHLGVARAWGQRAHDQGRPAALAANQLGDGIDLAGREGDHGRPARQPGQLDRADVFQVRKARPGDDVGIGQQPGDQRADGVRAHEHGLLAAAGAQQPVGEHVAALGIGGHLDFVDPQERHLPVHRHGLHRAQGVGGVGGGDLLLAGDQRDPGRPLDFHHPVVDLARQQAQREADHAAGMAQHALDRIVRLAGVGGAQDGDQAAAVAA